MIVVYHQNNQIIQIDYEEKNIGFSQKNIAKNLVNIAISYPHELIIWCHLDFKTNLNLLKFEEVFHHKRIMASYNPFKNSFLQESIGYVEESPFIKINKKVTYPTWQMSSCVGGLHASVLLALKDEIRTSTNFDYFLQSLAKLAIPIGLLCYSEPKLLKDISSKFKKEVTSNYILFRFVKQHYKTRWIFLLFLNLFLYERKFQILPLIFSFFYLRRNLNDEGLEKIQVQSIRKTVQLGTIDVIIPTIGRKGYLYDVLKDLSNQSHLPENVIIVEQNPNLDSVSELDYLTTESWPFTIKHTFTHQAGACNARNLALTQVKSEWIFLNDDDNRFEPDLISNALKNCVQYGTLVATNSYLKINEKTQNNNVVQASIFGSGNSFITSSLLEVVSFRMGFEFGYGEDSDFGMQLRNHGADVLFFSTPKIIHLSAPFGGFRTKPVLAWSSDVVQPKPSPTVMLYKQLHLTVEQINGYKTVLFFKYYRVQNIKNPIRYFLNFNKQWKQSLYWANKLKWKE